MQDFTVAPTSGVTLVDWVDPERPPGTLSGSDAGAPSRLNPIPGYPHKRYVGRVGIQIEITATVDGVAGPPDSALGGRTFLSWRAEGPTGYVFDLWTGLGVSSLVRFLPPAAGHYCIGMARIGGGSVLMHFDVLPTG